MRGKFSLSAKRRDAGTLFLAMAVMLTGAFWFISHNYSAQAAPTNTEITAVTPEQGLTAGGNTIVITGQDFSTESKYVDVANGYYSYACGVRDDKGVNCWGSLDRSTGINLPAEVSGLSDITQVSVGYSHACALTTTGNVNCWGSGYYGVRGNGTSTGYDTGGVADMTITTANISDVQQISAGGHYNCALKTDGTVWCWGLNNFGQVGNGSANGPDGILQPTQVPGLSGIIQVSAGWNYTCVLKSDNSVWCWGYGSNGALGNSSYTSSLVPVLVTNTNTTIPMAQISAGVITTCALSVDGASYCWGGNDRGQIGDGTSSPKNTPQQVQGLSAGTSTQVSTGAGAPYGNGHSCSVKTDQTVACWGESGYYALGNGVGVGTSYTPVAAVGLSDVTKVAANGNSTCALKADGTIWCWGYNVSGQSGLPQPDGLNNSNGYNITIPTQISLAPMNNLIRVTLDGLECTNLIVRSSTQAACIVPAHTAGTVDIVGTISVKAGGGTTTLQQSYTYVDFGITSITPAQGPTSGGGEVTIRGNGFVYDGPSQSSDIADFACTESQQSFTAGATGDYLLETWGAQGGYYSASLQGGKGGYTRGVVRLSAGETIYAYVGCMGGYYNDNGTLATLANLDTAGGYNGGGDGHKALGDNTRTTPTSIGSGYTQVSAGYYNLNTNAVHVCAVTTSATAECWGYNDYGQTGNGLYEPERVLTPTEVPGLTDVVQVSAGTRVSCALKSDNSVWCWGDNRFGIAGDGSTSTAPLLVPTKVDGLSATQVSVGSNYICAITTTGGVVCWGQGENGKLGSGDTTNLYTPTAVSGGNLSSGVAQISAAVNYTCAVKTDGSAWCWGLNNYGQLGNNTFVQSSIPVQVATPGGGAGYISDVKQISAGHSAYSPTTCAVTNGGSAYCWGYGYNSMFGNNNTTSNSNIAYPVQVHGIGGVGFLTGVQQISVGYDAACAVLGGGALVCWGGINNYGQIGDGTLNNTHPAPTEVSGMTSGVAQVSAGVQSACLVKSDSSLYCWGMNLYGQVGDGTFTENVLLLSASFGGGGATDFRLAGGEWDDTTGLLTRIIVAGGGGAGNSYNGGYGGGDEGGWFIGGWMPTGSIRSTGGTQDAGGQAGYYNYNGYYSYYGSAGQFGMGGSANLSKQSAWKQPGGGGGWYGGASGLFGIASGGGSGYALTASSYRPAGYGASDDYELIDAELFSGDQTFLSPSGVFETGHSGDGHARITGLVNLFSVTIGGQICTDLTIISATEAKCIVPAHAAGKVDVVAGFADGTNSTLVLGYEYIAPSTPPGYAPVIPGVPNTGRR